MSETYLVNWKAFDKSSVVEEISARNEESAKRKIISKYKNYPGYKGMEIEVISVNRINKRWWSE